MKKFFARMVASDVVATLESIEGGILCRLDDNRALAILLANEAPNVLLSHPEIYDWLKSNEVFFRQLSRTNIYRKSLNRLRNNRKKPRHFDFQEMSKFFQPRIKS